MKTLDGARIRAALENAKNNTGVLIGVVAAVFLLDATVLVRGQIIPLARGFSKANQLKKQIRQARSDTASLGAYRKNADELKSAISALEKKMTTDGDLPSVLESISKCADISAVRILRIKPVARTPDVNPQDLFLRQRIEVTLKSGFHQLGRFVALLENAATFMDIQRLEVTAEASDYMKQAVTIVLEVVVKKI